MSRSPRHLAALLAAFGCTEPEPPPTVQLRPPNDAGFVDLGTRLVQEPRADDLTVMTWNLERFPLTSTTARVVREQLVRFGVDVIGVQEIEDPEVFQALIDSTPGYDGFDAWDDTGFTRVGMMYRTARVTVDDIETIYRDDPWAFPRSPLTARITTTATVPFDFTFVVLHLKARGDSESRARRKAASRSLHRWITEKIRAGEDDDFVVVGDLNDRLTDERDDNVFLAFLDAPERYRFVTMPHAEAGDHTFLPFANMIDHILITAGAEDELVEGQTKVLHLENDVRRYEELVSDHIPVIARFRFGL